LDIRATAKCPEIIRSGDQEGQYAGRVSRRRHRPLCRWGTAYYALL